MNRRQKIIVSITGITLVLLILVGLTYGYFLTRIQGNSNSKSIETSTADLKLVYGDGSGTLTYEDKLVPNTNIGTKTFTVTNEGDATVDSYAVVFEDVSNNLDRPEDLVYTLTCESEKASCKGVEEETPFPLGNGKTGEVYGILVINSIESGDVQTYTLSLKYLEPGVDQSSDMNKTIEGKINIRDVQSLNPYEKGTLAYNIINNAINITSEQKNNGYAEFRTVPITEVAKENTTIFYEDEPSAEKSQTYTSNRYYTYGDSYIFNKYGGTYDVINKDGSPLKTAKYDEEFETLKGKYIVSTWGIPSSEPVSGTSMKPIYQVTNSSTATEMKYKEMRSSGKRNAESTLSTANDGLGVSYYFRGGVKNNYINFGGYCWRIVRIEGDGSVKIILADKDGECSTSTEAKETSALIGRSEYGYKYTNGRYLADYDNTGNSTYSIKYKFDKFLNGGDFEYIDSNYTNQTVHYNGLSEDTKTKLKNTQICIGNLTKGIGDSGELTSKAEMDEAMNNWENISYKKYYDVYTDKVARYTCESEETKINETNIYPLTIDEVLYAGASGSSNNNTFYLNDNAKEDWWTITLSGVRTQYIYQSDPFYIGSSGSIGSSNILACEYVEECVSMASIRPAVSLKAGIEFSSGDGTLGSPYEIQ